MNNRHSSIKPTDLCLCKPIEKYSCSCEVPEKSLSELNESQISELKRKVKSDLLSLNHSLNSVVEEYNERLKGLCNEKCKIIIAGLDPRYEAQQQLIESLESEFNQEIENYSKSISSLKNTRRKITSFEKFLNKNTREKSKYKKILSKFFFSKVAIPPMLIPLQLPPKSQRDCVSSQTISLNAPIEPSKISLSRTNTQKYDRNQVDLITKLAVQEKFEKNKIFYIFAPNILYSYDTNTFQGLKIQLNSTNQLQDGMICINIGDSYVFMFYSGKDQNPIHNKKALMLNLQDKSILSLAESYFLKQFSGAPVVYSDFLYFFGGLSDQGTKSPDCEVYSIVDNNWKIITQLDTPAFYVSGVNINDSIFLASNDFNSVKLFSPKNNSYQQFYPYDKITLANSFVFLIKIENCIYFFHQKGIYMISQPQSPVYFGAFGALANLREMVQYVVRGHTAFLLMSTKRIIKFTPVRGKNNCAEVLSIIS